MLSSEPMLSCIYSTGDYGRYRITSCGSSLRHWPPGTNNKPFVPSFFSVPPLPASLIASHLNSYKSLSSRKVAQDFLEEPPVPYSHRLHPYGGQLCRWAPSRPTMLDSPPSGLRAASTLPSPGKADPGQTPGVYGGFQPDAAAVCRENLPFKARELPQANSG